MHQNTPLPTSCVFRMNLDGTGARCLTGGRNVNTLPVFSPDGTKILYMSDRLSPGSFDAYVMDADGSHKKLIIPGGLVPNWGPRRLSRTAPVETAWLRCPQAPTGAGSQ